jgi:putative FmdB family regulatory protein
MPEYGYQCSKCAHYFSLVKPMSQAGDKEKCPECKGKAHREYSGTKVAVSIPKTLGYFMARNAEKMSEDEKQHIKNKARND